MLSWFTVFAAANYSPLLLVMSCSSLDFSKLSGLQRLRSIFFLEAIDISLNELFEFKLLLLDEQFSFIDFILGMELRLLRLDGLECAAFATGFPI